MGVKDWEEAQQTASVSERDAATKPVSPEKISDGFSDDQATVVLDGENAATIADEFSDLDGESRHSRNFPERVGPYRILSQIGEGGMGAVYKAVRDDDQYKQIVAVKLVRAGAQTDMVIRRFRNERQILASLDHPYICRLLDGGTTANGLPYLVMEHIDGVPINEYSDEQNLSIAERLRLFTKVCSAVQYAHQKLVIHRDIKPGNILVTPYGTPKLLDFGIAKLLDPSRSDLIIDRSATAFGMMTPDYASPEQVRGDQITTASDTYSLGVVLYQLLTGLRPYTLKSFGPHDIVRAICEQEPLRPSTAVTNPQAHSTGPGEKLTSSLKIRIAGAGTAERLKRRLVGDLDNIVLVALRKEPERRYASVEQFAQDIQRHLDGRPVIARGDTFMYRASKFAGRNRLAITGALLLLMTLIAGIVATNQQRLRAERRFNDVRRLANSLMFEMHDAIEQLPGSTNARQLLVKRALEYLDSLAKEEGNDVSLQRELIRSYLKVGDVQGYPFEANLGNTEGALQSYRKALAISERLAVTHPSDLENNRDLLTTYERIGDVLQASGDMKAALEQHQKALGIARGLIDSHPENWEVRRNIMISFLKMGETLLIMGDRGGSFQNYKESLKYAEELFAHNPDDNRARRDVSVLYNKMGDALLANGDNDGALTRYKQALDVRTVVTAREPLNVQARRDVAVDLEKIATVLVNKQDYAGALDFQGRALESDERLAAADPANVDAQLDLALSIGNVGDIYLLLGNNAESISRFQRSISILEKLHSSNPDNSEVRGDIADAYFRVSDALIKSNKLDLAAGYLFQSVAIYKDISAADAGNADIKIALARSLARFGELQMRMAGAKSGDRNVLWTQAKEHIQQARQIFLELRSQGSLEEKDSTLPEMLADELAKCDQALGSAKR